MPTRTVRYNYRAYLTPTQKDYLRGLFGATRAIYNSFIWEREELRRVGLTESMSETLSKVTAFKCQPAEREWLKQYPAKAIQYAGGLARDAYQDYFDGLQGKRSDKPGRPRYKRKHDGHGSAYWSKPSKDKDFEVRKLNKQVSRVYLQKWGGCDSNPPESFPARPRV